MDEQLVVIPGTTAGQHFTVPVLRFGVSGDGRKAYIQAGIHADEAPALVVAQHLRMQLTELERRGAVVGAVVLIPMANPIGLSQYVLGRHEGRFDLADGINFNRNFPLLAEIPAVTLRQQLSDDTVRNGRYVRSALRSAIAEIQAVTPAQNLKRMLLSLAVDADTVLDLHCDGEAVMHLYTLTTHAADFAPLARLIGARAHLVSENSGGHPFDEAVSRPWLELARRFPECPLPAGPIATTLELRGRADVDQRTAAEDAEAIIKFLIVRGHISGDVPVLPTARCIVTPLEGCEALQAPSAGIVAYAVEVGAEVVEGALVAEIIDPMTGAVAPVRAAAAGVFFARSSRRMAEAGMRLGKIAGNRPFRSGALLSP